MKKNYTTPRMRQFDVRVRILQSSETRQNRLTFDDQTRVTKDTWRQYDETPFD